MRKLVHLIVHKWIRDWEDKHDQEVRSRYGVLEGWISIGVNFLLFLVKGIFGSLTGSVSLIADAFHTLSDVSTSCVILVSFRMAKKPSDVTHPFGHGRMEAIATVVVAVLLLVVGVEIFRGALGRLLQPKDFEASWLIIGIIVLSILIKELLARFSRELGRLIDSPALEADFWHHRTDAISSVLVIVAFLSQRLGLPHMDGAAGVVVAGMIVYTGWRIAQKGVDNLLGVQPSKEFVQKVKKAVRDFPEIIDVHDLIIHQYGQMIVMSFHIQVSDRLSLKKAHALADDVGKKIDEKFHTHTTIHIDPINTSDPEIRKMGDFVKKFLDKLDGKATYHDLRTVGEEGMKNILFDLSVDPGMKDKEIECLKQELQAALLNAFPSVTEVVVKVEPKYAL